MKYSRAQVALKSFKALHEQAVGAIPLEGIIHTVNHMLDTDWHAHNGFFERLKDGEVPTVVKPGDGSDPAYYVVDGGGRSVIKARILHGDTLTLPLFKVRVDTPFILNDAVRMMELVLIPFERLEEEILGLLDLGKLCEAGKWKVYVGQPPKLQVEILKGKVSLVIEETLAMVAVIEEPNV